MSTRGAVAAGHPLTAEAGADVLREGGNAVDAAVAAVLTSFVTESPLTGLGAGGFMLVHAPDEDVLLDFFVAVPGADGVERRSELDPDPGLLHRGRPAGLQRRRRLVRGAGHRRGAWRGAASGSARCRWRSWLAPARELARDGRAR